MIRSACIHVHRIHFGPHERFNETVYEYEYIGDALHLPILIYYTRVVQTSEMMVTQVTYNVGP